MPGMMAYRPVAATTRCGKQSSHGWSMASRAGSQHCKNRTILARRHLLPALGSRRLAELTADEVDRWLAGKSGR